MADLRAAVSAAAEQTRLLFGRVGDLVRGQRGQGDPSSLTARGLQLDVEDKPLPLNAFSGFVPREVKNHEREALGAFVTGSAKLAPRDGQAKGMLGLETRGLTAGTDLNLGDGSSAGVAFGYANNPEEGGKVEAGTVSAYAAHTEGKLGVEAVAGAGGMRLHGESAERGAMVFAGLGANWDLRPAKGVGVLPWIRLDLSGADMGGGALAAVTGAGMVRVSAAAGIAAGYEMPVRWGRLRSHAALDLRQVSIGGSDQTEAGAAYGGLPGEGTAATLRLGFLAELRGGPTLTLDGLTDGWGGPDPQHVIQARMKMKF